MAQSAIVLDFEGHRLHALQRVGSELLWFVLADVCELLGIARSDDLAARLDDDQKGTASIRTLGGPQTMIVVSEDGVYDIATTSRKPIAKRFKRWLYREVLPEIRRTGSYHGGSAPLDALIGSMQTALPFESTVIPFEKLKSEYSETNHPNSTKPPFEDRTDRRSREYRDWALARSSTDPKDQSFDTWTDHENGRSYPIIVQHRANRPYTMWFHCMEKDVSHRIELPNWDGRGTVTLCFNNMTMPPYNVIERNFVKLGEGDYTPIALSTLDYWYGYNS